MLLTVAQRHDWSPTRTLMVCFTLFHAGNGYAAARIGRTRTRGILKSVIYSVRQCRAGMYGLRAVMSMQQGGPNARQASS